MINRAVVANDSHHCRTQSSCCFLEFESWVWHQITELTNMKSTMPDRWSLANLNQTLDKAIGDISTNKVVRFIQPANADALWFRDVA